MLGRGPLLQDVRTYSLAGTPGGDVNTLWGQLLEHKPSEVETPVAEGWRGLKAGEVGVSKQIYHGQRETHRQTGIMERPGDTPFSKV